MYRWLCAIIKTKSTKKKDSLEEELKEMDESVEIYTYNALQLASRSLSTAAKFLGPKIVYNLVQHGTRAKFSAKERERILKFYEDAEEKRTEEIRDDLDKDPERKALYDEYNIDVETLDPNDETDQKVLKKIAAFEEKMSESTHLTNEEKKAN